VTSEHSDRRFVAVAVVGTFAVAALAGILNAVARVSRPFSFNAFGRDSLSVGDSGMAAISTWWLLPVVVAVLVAVVVAVAAYASTRSRAAGWRPRAVGSFAVAALPVFLLALAVGTMRPLVVLFGLEYATVPVLVGRLSLWGLVVPICLLVLLPAGAGRWYGSRHPRAGSIPWVKGFQVGLASALTVGFAAGNWLGIEAGDALVAVGGAGW
jgi:hypothetical protein